MLLGTKPATVTTHERNIIWSAATLIGTQASSGLLPPKIIEAEGYFPSDIIQITPIRTVDGGYRHVSSIASRITSSSVAQTVSDSPGSSSAIWSTVSRYERRMGW